MKEMEELKRFKKSTERKIEELEMTLQNISGKSNVNYNNNENSVNKTVSKTDEILETERGNSSLGSNSK